jgi:hypothetical protein
VARSCTFFTFLEQELEMDSGPMDILLITPFVGERMQNQISKLRMKGHSVDIILLKSPAEEELHAQHEEPEAEEPARRAGGTREGQAV